MNAPDLPHNWPDYAASRLAYRRRLAADAVQAIRTAEKACPPLRRADGQRQPRHGKAAIADLPDNVAVATPRPRADNRIWFKQARDWSCFELFDADGKFLIIAGINFASVFETADAIGCVVVGSWANRPDGRRQHIYRPHAPQPHRAHYLNSDGDPYMLTTGGGTVTVYDPSTGQAL